MAKTRGVLAIQSATGLKTDITCVTVSEKVCLSLQMKTAKRLYHFLANEHKTATDWIDKIQSCIQ